MDLECGTEIGVLCKPPALRPVRRKDGGWEMSHGCGAEPGTPRLSLGAGIEACGQLDAQAGAGEGSQ